MTETALVFGMGVSGEAVARHLRDRGARVIAIDDRPTDEARARAEGAGVVLEATPPPQALRRLVGEVDVVVPTPGLPESHPVIVLAQEAGTPVRSEIEMASRWTLRPIVAITGTNGKTTVTELVAAMLNASGLRAVACGNIGLALADGVRRDADVFVAEVSSFQLRFTDTFRPQVAVWLNLAADHLDWHPDMEAYAAAKARIWERQTGEDMAVVNADDDVVMRWAATAPSTVTTFGLQPPADWHVDESGSLAGPDGPLLPVTELPRALPHDVSNSLAAAAAAFAAGALVDGVVDALRTFRGLPHRVTLVAASGGVQWYDDSKATNPHATLAALAQFESVVLIAGGRNKGLDLSSLRDAAPSVRAVIALGEAASEVSAAFGGLRPVTVVAGMDEAVKVAAELAEPGDAVVLSPACTSWDQYRSYAERGDHFTRLVRDLVGGGS